MDNQMDISIKYEAYNFDNPTHLASAAISTNPKLHPARLQLTLCEARGGAAAGSLVALWRCDPPENREVPVHTEICVFINIHILHTLGITRLYIYTQGYTHIYIYINIAHTFTHTYNHIYIYLSLFLRNTCTFECTYILCLCPCLCLGMFQWRRDPRSSRNEVIAGPPAAGKGTQCEKIKEPKFGLMSTGMLNQCTVEICS
jgi:hypothetical protein